MSKPLYDVEMTSVFKKELKKPRNVDSIYSY